MLTQLQQEVEADNDALESCREPVKLPETNSFRLVLFEPEQHPLISLGEILREHQQQYSL